MPFEFLNFFNSGASVISAGMSIFNTYANLRAQKEIGNSAISKQRYQSQKHQLDVAWDQQKTQEATREYGEICSYKIDMLRQEQLHNRQVMGYNILRSGIGITSLDSAGLLLRFQAYNDEMQARSIEAEMYHQRPKATINPAGSQLFYSQVNKNIRNIQESQPLQNTATIVRGIRNLSGIFRGDFNK